MRSTGRMWGAIATTGVIAVVLGNIMWDWLVPDSGLGQTVAFNVFILFVIGLTYFLSWTAARSEEGPPRDEERLASSEERYRTLVKDVKDYAIFLLDAEGRVQTWNEGARRIKGYEPEEIIGHPIDRFYPPEDRAAGKPQRLLGMARELGSVEDLGWRIRKNGTRFWADVVITALFGSDGTLAGYSKVTRDLTQQKLREDEERAQQELLARSEQRYRTLVKDVKDYAIFLLDAQGRVQTWNEGARRIKGYEAEEIIGEPIDRFYPPEDMAAGKPQRLLAKAREDGSVEDLDWRIRKDGSRFWADVVITALFGPDGTLTGYSKVTRDLTEQKRLADEEREAQRQLLETNKQMERFASVASHDLQAPLRQIASFVQLLERSLGDGLTPKQKEYIRYIGEGATRLQLMVQSLLKYSQIQNHEMQTQEVDLEGVVRTVVDDLRPLIEENGATVHIDELPAVQGDPELLARVFQNLVDNAIKYRSEEPPLIRVWGEEAGSEGATKVTIHVEDNGIGFEQVYAERIFEMFQRLESDDRGTGIGLALSKSIVERHGGTIRATSAPGEGATFTIELPKKAARMASVQPKTASLKSR